MKIRIQSQDSNKKRKKEGEGEDSNHSTGQVTGEEVNDEIDTFEETTETDLYL